MRPFGFALVLAILALLPAASQTSPETGLDRGADIPVEEWRAMAMGRTLTYRINGDLWALEHYFAGGNHVALQLYDGTCMTGTWDYVAPHYCFHWDGQGTSCFRHTRLGDEVFVIETLDGQDSAMSQEMTGVSDAPVTCGPAVTS
jgi:hypothetical protein